MLKHLLRILRRVFLAIIVAIILLLPLVFVILVQREIPRLGGKVFMVTYGDAWKYLFYSYSTAYLLREIRARLTCHHCLWTVTNRAGR